MVNGLVVAAKMAAHNRGVQTPVRGEHPSHVRPVPAALVGNDCRAGERAVLEDFVNGAGAANCGKQHQRLAALTQHGAT